MDRSARLASSCISVGIAAMGRRRWISPKSWSGMVVAPRFLAPHAEVSLSFQGSVRGASCAGDDEEQQGEKWRDDVRQNEKPPEAQKPVASIEADQYAANEVDYDKCRECKLRRPKVFHVPLSLDDLTKNECAYPRGYAPISTPQVFRPGAPVVLKITGAPGSRPAMRLAVRWRLQPFLWSQGRS